MNTTIISAIHNNYKMDRLSIEAVLKYIPEDQYKEYILVDDCSNERKTIDFLKHLNDYYPKVRVIKSGDPAQYSYYNKYSRGKDGISKALGKETNVSIGHGESINLGLNQVTTDYALVIDSDTMFLPKAKTLIPQMIKCMELDDKIVAVGQCAGQLNGIDIQTKTFDFSHKVAGLISGGTPHASLILCNMKSWTEYGLKKWANRAWGNNNWTNDAFGKGYKTCNFNTYRDGYAIHIGYSSVRISREQEKVRTYGFVKNGNYGRLGSSASPKDWYVGYYSVNLTTNELDAFLHKNYDNQPYAERKSLIHKIVDKKLLKE